MLELSGLVSLDLSMNSLMLQNPSFNDLVQKLSRLEKLHLAGVNISSRVPQSLSNLTSLSSLVLDNCSIQGEFPSGIFRLPNLRVLSIWFNPNLTGYLPDFNQVGTIPLEMLLLGDTNFSGQLPLSIGNLKSLNVFSASRCNFNGTIPFSIGNLTNLNVLELADNNFNGSIPSSITNLSRLTHLSLSYNKFDPGTLDWLVQLTKLEMVKTNLHGPIPSSIGNLTWLTRLLLDNNKLSGPIPDSIFRLSNIEVLVLSSNQLNGSVEIGSFLQLKHLFDLHLSYNQLSLVTSSLINSTLPKFRTLRLAYCNLTEFPPFLQWQPELEALMLSMNNITGFIPKWLFSLEKLNVLDLSYNFFQGFEHPVPSFWTNLKVRRLASNSFQGPLPIPSPSIAVYHVSKNRFSGEVSPLFCNLKSLLVLSLSENDLTGELPSCLSNFSGSLRVLNLRNNSFSGKISDNFASGCSLELMDFSQNKLEGKVPRSLAYCSRLEILNLEENRFNDVFPSWLGILPLLRVLSLRSNGFYGSIGKPLTKLEFTRFQIIDLSNNKFVGKLPLEYLENSVAMKSVGFDKLGYMQSNTTFQIGGFVLTFPKAFYIRIVNKGTERAYDGILEFFMAVDLSSNKFEGEIPETIGSLTNLQLLNLSNNFLTGHIPKSLSNLGKLEALDLSQNGISGNIPTQLSALNFHSIFNLSYNNLSGLIPQGNKFDTYSNDSFLGNLGLCGHPLSKGCGALSTFPSEDEENEEDSPFWVNWEIVLIGFAGGLVVGVSFGSVFDVMKYQWLVKKFERWLRNWRN